MIKFWAISLGILIIDVDFALISDLGRGKAKSELSVCPVAIFFLRMEYDFDPRSPQEPRLPI